MSDSGPKTTDGIFDSWLSNSKVSLVNSAPELHLECLEERVLYSAVPVPVDLVQHVDIETVGEDIDVFAEPGQSLELISNGIENYLEVGEADSELDLTSSTMAHLELGQDRIEIVFVDQSVGDYQDFVNDILNSADPNTHYEIALIDPNNNGPRTDFSNSE